MRIVSGLNLLFDVSDQQVTVIVVVQLKVMSSSLDPVPVITPPGSLQNRDQKCHF